MNIKITYRREGRSDHEAGESWEVEAIGIQNFDGDKAVQAILDAGAMMKVGAYGNAQLIVSGLKGWSGEPNGVLPGPR